MKEPQQTPTPLTLDDYIEMEGIRARLSKTSQELIRAKELQARWLANPVRSWTDEDLAERRKEQIRQNATL